MLKGIESAAALVIQRAFRGYQVRKNLKLKTIAIGKGIINTTLSMMKPSLLFGDAGIPLDLNKMHEIMITRIKLSDVSLVLSTNQGTQDALMKHLKDCEASYGAVINGGFYAINGFYYLGTDKPIGLHRFAYNASVGARQDTIKTDVNSISEYFRHTNDELSKPFDDFSDEDIPTQLHLKTQTPASVQQHYGAFRITKKGKADIQQYTDFHDDKAFNQFVSKAEYLLTSGPILVKDSQVTLTKDDLLTDPRYQFKVIYDRFGSHPGSVPPGSFYHADQLNPRSAIGFTSEDELLMVTVKGEEDPSKRDGMRLDQFALLMKLLGAKTALNLDGGYSACQGVFNKHTMEKPLFLKKVGREKALPCSIVAKEKTTVAKAYPESRYDIPSQKGQKSLVEAKRKLF